MPDVNLLRNTQQPEDRPPKPRPPANPRLTDPQAEPKKSLGDSLRSLLGKRSAPDIVVPKSSAMAVGRGPAGQRILSDKSTTIKTAPNITPLPEDDDFNVNLLTEDVASTFNLRLRLIQIGLVAVGAAVLVGLVFVGLGFYEKSIESDVQTTREQTLAAQTEITKLEKDLTGAKEIATRLDAFQSLVGKHVRWTNFFDRLERYTLPEVTYGGSFSGTLSTTLNFSATTDSFERLAKQYLIYEQAIAAGDFITDFSITAASRSVEETNEKVTFSVSMQLVPTIFDNPLPTTTPASQ